MVNRKSLWSENEICMVRQLKAMGYSVIEIKQRVRISRGNIYKILRGEINV